MAQLDTVTVALNAALLQQRDDALFALETLIEHVNALGLLPRQFHRNDWTLRECMESAREWREYVALNVPLTTNTQETAPS